jgi:hypothetical protein
MICSMRVRSGNKLPQIHEDSISIRDHLITSTLSHVESYEFEYFRTNLRRMMLVMDALAEVSRCYKRHQRRGTHKDPTLIMKMTPALFLVLICSFQSTGKGTSRMMKSSTMLRPAPVNPITADTGRHFASVIVLSQMDLIGQHWKTTRRKTKPWVNMKAIIPRTLHLNHLMNSGNRREYRLSMATLEKIWTST